MKIERRQYGLIDVKLAASEVGTFSGYGAIFGNIDSYNEEIQKGAFAEDLKRWERKGKWPKMLLQHGGMGLGSDDMMPVGQWTDMREDERGLKVSGRLFALNTERGQYIYEGLKSGELDSLSIGFQPIDSEMVTRDGDPVKLLTKIKLWEVSIVTFPANDKAKISTVKMTVDEMRELEKGLRDAGLSRADAATAVSFLKNHYLLRDAGEPVNAPRDEDVSDEVAAALAAAEGVAARLVTAGLRF